MLTQAELQLIGPDGTLQALLDIRCRAGHTHRNGIPFLVEIQPDDKNRTLSLLEEAEYLYELRPSHPLRSIRLEPREFFDPDDPSGIRGRLRPGLYVGTVWVRGVVDDAPMGSAQLEVRSAKLSYETDYRRMLSAIASEGAELLMQRFAPSIAEFTPDADQPAHVLYQRFAFLQSVVESESFAAAMQEILKRPHHAYERETEERVPGRGVKGSSLLMRKFSRPGPRTRWPGRGALESFLPARLEVTSFTSALDTEANRFVKFVLKHWRSTCQEIAERLHVKERTAPVERGLRASRELLNELDSILGYPLFSEVGELGQLPLANQVLLRREGYRELLRMFVESEASARLQWEGSEDVFGAGQRDVATLYEYWVYLQLRKIIQRLCSDDMSLFPLFVVSPDGMVMSLRRGRAKSLNGTVERLGRRLSLELWFNRTFRESWTREMRPDCSLRVSASPGLARQPTETWLHFDAKYRVERITELFGAEENVEVDEIAEKRADLLKMHAYRDAIKRTSGAYVIYPGEERRGSTRYQPYDEILPGLGAFALRPGSDGDAETWGASALAGFIDEVLTHVASQASQRERAEYWRDVAYKPLPPGPIEASPFLDQPPADTQVLLGYVKNKEHLEWILRRGLYNLRADNRTGSVGLDASALGAQFILLYGPSTRSAMLFRRVDAPLLMTAQELLESAYPEPGGALYCCLRLGDKVEPAVPITTTNLMEFVRVSFPSKEYGAPAVVTWQRLAEHDDLIG